jgi:hypothetical protein
MLTAVSSSKVPFLFDATNELYNRSPYELKLRDELRSPKALRLQQIQHIFLE